MREGRAMKEEGKQVEAVHQTLRHEVCVKMTAQCPPELKRRSGGGGGDKSTAKDEL